MNQFIETSTYRVDFLGPWSAAAVRLQFDLADFRPPADKFGLIDRTFERAQADARAHEFDLFNGKLARLAHAEGGPLWLRLTLQPTDFKTHLVTNLLLPEQFGPAERSDALGVSAVIRSSDGRLVLGRRSQQVAYNRGKLHTIGGVMDWVRPAGGDQTDGGLLFDQVLKEMFEELAVQPEDPVAVTALALVHEKRIHQPEVICLAQVNLPAAVLADRWSSGGNHEHVELWTCPDSPAAVAAALARDPGQFTPVATATLLAHLSIAHGSDAVAALIGP